MAKQLSYKAQPFACNEDDTGQTTFIKIQRNFPDIFCIKVHVVFIIQMPQFQSFSLYELKLLYQEGFPVVFDMKIHDCYFLLSVSSNGGGLFTFTLRQQWKNESFFPRCL